MDKELNLVEKLRDCPHGTKLYSPMYGEVLFDGIVDDCDRPIKVKIPDEWCYGGFAKDGRCFAGRGECLLFPSKDNHDWETFCMPVKRWNKQVEKDLFNEQVDWSATYYSVILKDGHEREVQAYADECADGNVTIHFEYIDNYWYVDFDDILLWRKIEL